MGETIEAILGWLQGEEWPDSGPDGVSYRTLWTTDEGNEVFEATSDDMMRWLSSRTPKLLVTIRNSSKGVHVVVSDMSRGMSACLVDLQADSMYLGLNIAVRSIKALLEAGK